MSLRELNGRTRARLRFHGWLLTLWCVAIGMVTSALLLHLMHLRAPAARYAISGVLMYAIGLVVGTRFWLHRFSRSVREEPVLGSSDRAERVGFDAEQRDHERRGIGSKIRRTFELGDFFGSVADLFSGFGELAAWLFVPALVLFAIGILMLLGLAPMFVADGAAALLAEMAVQFVFGALLVRGVMRPQPHGDAFVHIVGKTWVAGLLLLVASAGAGWLLTRIEPGAVSIGDLFRR
ncbi:MAG: hypothetical protein ABI781_15050 [Burkholderiales bacterium]